MNTNEIRDEIKNFKGKDWEFSPRKTSKVILELCDHIDELEKALREIAAGDGYYGAQAREYKEIARRALEERFPLI